MASEAEELTVPVDGPGPASANGGSGSGDAGGDGPGTGGGGGGGGGLRVLRWSAAEADAPVVLALHGITANGLSWARVAHHLAGRVTLVAPDLRGRAGSRDLGGPYGLPAHVADVAALVAALELDRPVLTGHSMGAFVAVLAAARHPRLFSRLLLVDGGIGLPIPAGLSAEELITAVLGPALTRLSMTFPDRAAYREFWQRHPAFGGTWSPWVDAYIQRDLVGTEPELRSSCRLEAVRTDGVGQFDDEVPAAVHQVRCPTELLWAERGLMDEPQGLYDERRLDAAGIDRGRVDVRAVPGLNHYTVLVGDEGARLVAERLLAGCALLR